MAPGEQNPNPPPSRSPDRLLNPLVRGFFILLPVILTAIVVEKLYLALSGIVHRLLESTSGVVIQNPTLRVAAVLVAVLLCLVVTGLLARTRTGVRLGRGIERAVLNRLPFYAVLRNLASGLAGKDEEGSLRPVLVEVNPGLRQFGLLVERRADGGGTVFLPSSPATGSGTVLVVEAALIQELRQPGHKVLQALGKWGLGSLSLAPPAAPFPPHPAPEKPNGDPA